MDVDNLLGDPRDATPASIRGALAAYRIASGYGRCDLVVLATNHAIGVEVSTAWPGARLLVRSGKDGADLALIEEARSMPTGRVTRVVVGSGDHIFIDVVNELHAAGLQVSVVSRPLSLARALRRAADVVIDLTAVAA